MNIISDLELSIVTGATRTCYGLFYDYGDKGTVCYGVSVPE